MISQSSSVLQSNFVFSPLQKSNLKRMKSLQCPSKIPVDCAFNQILKRIQNSNEIVKTSPNYRHQTDKQYQSTKYNDIVCNKQNMQEQNNKSSSSYKSLTKTKPRKLFGKIQINLSNFVLGSIIGSGTFGDVFLCKQRSTLSCYALKKIMKSTIKSYKLQSQISNQIKIHGLLDHPNIVKFYGVFNDQYHVFLLMEYASQGILLKHLNKGEKFTSRILSKIIDAIEYLQTKNIIHRDIKPENIVMVNGVPKLCDFGWAAVCDSRRRTFCGTLDYVSPQVLENKQYDFSVDIWSLGVLCYQLLTGQPPFQHKDKSVKMDMIKKVQDNLKIPQTFSQQARHFILKCLQKNPQQRLTIQQAKEHPLIKKHQKRRRNE